MSPLATPLPGGWRLLPTGPDKVPLLRDWPRRAVPVSEVATLEAWLRRWPRCALALATGAASGVLVLDVDTPAGHGTDGRTALARLEAELGPLPSTATARTPSGGVHLFFAWPAGVARIPSRPLAPGLDVKASGGCVVLPGGERTPGRLWLRPPEGRLAALPACWRARLLPPPPPVRFGGLPRGGDAGRYAEAALRSACERVATAKPGTRNDTLFREAASLARLEALGDADIVATLADAARRAGLPRREVEATLRSALRRRAGASRR